ncbi:YwqG family protein [Streptomyces sp. BI20]|uniref:YwqG family protein n=1 Tax=Streptomyces sp. BI20 TaxID=3403460 RepID=UPI003C73E2B6
MTHASAAALHALARAHLSPEDAETWIGLLAPGLRLDSDPEAEGPLVGRLGGLPDLPADVPWPHWEGHGPLSFVATLDCAALSAAGDTGLALPASGALLLFHFDGRVDDGDAFVGPDEPESRPGARILHVPGDAVTATRPAPEELPPYPEAPLRGVPGLTALGGYDPRVRAAFGLPRVIGRDETHPLYAEAFTDALYELSQDVHRVGGHAAPIQNPVEWELAHGLLGPDTPWNDPATDAEAAAWVPLVQIDTDDRADMMWGDAGALYWLIRPADLAAGRFEEAGFTWQCC